MRFPHAGAVGTGSAVGAGAAAPVLCWAPLGSVGALARDYSGITRPAREVGAGWVGREIGTKMSGEKLCGTGEGLSCERFFPKGPWPWLLVPAPARLLNSFSPKIFSLLVFHSPHEGRLFLNKIQ